MRRKESGTDYSKRQDLPTPRTTMWLFHEKEKKNLHISVLYNAMTGTICDIKRLKTVRGGSPKAAQVFISI